MKFIDFLWSATHGLNGFIIQLFVCELLFTLPVKLRRRPYILVPLCIVLYFGAGWAIRYIPSMGVITASVYCIILFVFSLALQQICFRQSFKRTLFNSSAAYILQNLALNAEEAVTMFVDGRGWKLLVMALVIAAVYAFYYFVLIRRNRGKEVRLNSLSIVAIALFSVLVSNVLFSLSVTRGFTAEQMLPVKVLFVVSCNLALFFQFVIFRNAALNSEKAIVEQLLVNEQKQHKMSQQNIDLINIKCHDLKKQINLLQNSIKSGNMDELFKDVKNAVSVYDESVNTGNSNLDLVLTEKQLYCYKNKIRIEIMTDGEKLNFMSPTDIYSFFGNALDNAMECVVSLEESSRFISLEVWQKGDFVSVTVSNPCSCDVVMKDGIPVTSKADKKYHGFGTLSMKYIAEKYGGNIVFTEKDGIFAVCVLFPLSRENKA